MSSKNQNVIFENEGIRVVERDAKDCAEGSDYHVYAKDTDDFGDIYWKWIGKSGLDVKEVRFAQMSRR